MQHASKLLGHCTLLTQDDDNLREALRYSAAMLGELRTSQLTPQKYFELYMQTFTELQHLEVCLIIQLSNPRTNSLR